MAYTFKEIAPETYQVENHTIIKDCNGKWVADPPIENTRLKSAFFDYIKSLDSV